MKQRLAIDAAGTGDWPDGLLSDAAGMAENGLVVAEVWESRAVQERVVQQRLGAALAAAGVTEPPSSVEWIGLSSYAMPNVTAA